MIARRLTEDRIDRISSLVAACVVAAAGTAIVAVIGAILWNDPWRTSIGVVFGLIACDIYADMRR